jgi:hypothetical protein
MGRKNSSTAPWTWEEIAKLKGKAADAFMKTYGDRGVAALLASGHAPGTWKEPCPYAGREPCVFKYREEYKGKCPMDNSSEWRNKHSQRPCSQESMEVYTRMVEKLGLLPKEEK